MRHQAGDQVEELAEEDGGLDREHGVPRDDHLDTGVMIMRTTGSSIITGRK